MAEFYRFPQWILTALVMIVAVCIALQTLAISYSFRRLPAGWARKVENGMECAVLAALFFFAALLGQVQYGLYGSFLLPSAYGNARQVVFLLGAVLGATAAVGAELIWPFFVIGGLAVLLPLTEAITGAAYPFFFLAALLYFLVRSVHICLLRRRELYTQISSISIKEAIDTLHTGLLFFRQSGEPLLCNRRMDALARQLTGQPLRSGLEFQRHLESGGAPGRLCPGGAGGSAGVPPLRCLRVEHFCPRHPHGAAHLHTAHSRRRHSALGRGDAAGPAERGPGATGPGTAPHH